ncbi:hypothetical protein EYF80_005305 [Liparis tanakae]|uniref:Uncharacterized protein n=1 Tax=Liparis tanakae TaxID=230148 RepID=A0A4Z2J4C3_9TELE|nr:hypothetical protein EYF80_005305 [Liparis tanakae]
MGREDDSCFSISTNIAEGVRREERCRVFLHSSGGGGGGSSLAPYANKIPEHRCHMIALGEGWDLPSADPAEQEGLCQLSGDVMIYFEEMMSGLCSEAGGVYSGTTLNDLQVSELGLCLSDAPRSLLLLLLCRPAHPRGQPFALQHLQQLLNGLVPGSECLFLGVDPQLHLLKSLPQQEELLGLPVVFGLQPPEVLLRQLDVVVVVGGGAALLLQQLVLKSLDTPRPNRNTYVGFTQQGSGFDGSHLQNRLRRPSGSPGSARIRSLNTDTVGGSSSQRFPSSGNRRPPSQPAKSGYDAVKLVQSSSASKPNWRTNMFKQENVQMMPKKPLSFSASISSGSSLSKYTQSPTSKKGTWPVQQGTQSTSNHRSSSSESFLGPNDSFKPNSHQTSAQKSSVNSETPADTGAMGYSTPMKSSRQSSAGAAEPRRVPVRTKTSASAPARRVSSRRGSAASKRTGAWKPYSSKVVPVDARNRPASGTSSAGTSGQDFAPSVIQQIPERYGGYAIRRMKEPADQKEGSLGKHQAYVAPRRKSLLQKRVYVAPQRPSLKEQDYVAPQRPSLQKQTYMAPQRPSLLQKRPSLQKQPYMAPQRPSLQKQTYVAPQRPSLQKQTYVAPQRQSWQQPYVVTQRPSASSTQNVRSVHPGAKWRSVGLRLGQ